MHKIMLEEDHKPLREHQKRLKPIMSEVVRKEVLKHQDASIIYSILDKKWVSTIHDVPKKGGMIVIKNEKG